MKILLDTNVALDAIASRKPYNKNAEKIFLLTAEEKIEGFITANCVTDIYYIARKTLTDAGARGALRYMFSIFSVVDIRGKDCETALELPIADYEDALLTVCAKKIAVDYIITRDEDLQKASPGVPAISPSGFLRIFPARGD